MIADTFRLESPADEPMPPEALAQRYLSFLDLERSILAIEIGNCASDGGIGVLQYRLANRVLLHGAAPFCAAQRAAAILTAAGIPLHADPAHELPRPPSPS